MTKSSSGTFAILLAAAVALLAYWTALSSGNGAATDGSLIVDPATGIGFPPVQRFKVGKDLSLLGVGVRKKAVINVYAVGFYGHKSVAKAVGEKSKKKALEAIISAKGPRAAQLTFAMGVGAAKMAEALSNIDGVAQESKDKFSEMILTGIGGKMKKGETMTLEWKGSDVVVVTARGSPIGEMKDKDLFKGLLNVYLGPKSVSPSLKANIGAK